MLDDLLALFAPWKTCVLVVAVLVAFVLPWGLFLIVKAQRDSARAEVALQEAEARSLQQRVLIAESENERLAAKLTKFQAWVQDHPAPKDPEAMRQWLLEAGKR